MNFLKLEVPVSVEEAEGAQDRDLGMPACHCPYDGDNEVAKKRWVYGWMRRDREIRTQTRMIANSMRRMYDRSA